MPPPPPASRPGPRREPRPRSEPHSWPAAALAFVAGLFAGAAGLALATRLSTDRDLALFEAVRELAGETYVEPVDSTALVDDALAGMLSGLDRYSRFYGPEDIAQVDRSTRGEFRGIGAVFRAPLSAGQVLYPAPDSPAERAGLRVGDTLLSIDGALVAALGEGELQAHLQRADDAPLVLDVRSLDGEERRLTIVPEPILDPSVRHGALVDEAAGIAYVALIAFSNHTVEEFDRALAALHADGMRSLILDLRGNGGGTVDAAVGVANRFIPTGRLVATRTREATQVVEAKPEEARELGLPLVVLVDRDSASASEILAGALQDHGAAVLIGEPTYGKGTVQTLTRFGQDRAIVKLTTAHYLTPAWRRIERDEADPDGTGIAPDVLVPLQADLRRALHLHLLRYSPPRALVPAIRAWEAESGLELLPVHPSDPQRDAAIALLRGEAPKDAVVAEGGAW